MQDNDELLRMQIAENIAYYRRQHGDTQAMLAQKLNYSDKSVSKWERGDGTPDIFILYKIANLYDITVQDLLCEKKAPKARMRRILITLLSVGLAWLVATVLFCAAKILRVFPEHAWLLFLYALPVNGIICEVYCVKWWGDLAQLLAASLILWGSGICLVLSLQIESIVLLFIICAVVQVLLSLFFLLKHLRKRGH